MKDFLGNEIYFKDTVIWSPPKQFDKLWIPFVKGKALGVSSQYPNHISIEYKDTDGIKQTALAEPKHLIVVSDLIKK